MDGRVMKLKGKYKFIQDYSAARQTLPTSDNRSKPFSVIQGQQRAPGSSDYKSKPFSVI
jgi:hypothetical protein